jgi:hypothetical protein
LSHFDLNSTRPINKIFQDRLRIYVPVGRFEGGSVFCSRRHRCQALRPLVSLHRTASAGTRTDSFATGWSTTATPTLPCARISASLSVRNATRTITVRKMHLFAMPF